jgi:hypothetical protein
MISFTKLLCPGRWTAAVPVLFLFVTAAAAQPGGSRDPLFTSHELLEVTIAAPFRLIMQERPIDKYEPGTLRYQDSDGTFVELEIGVRTRGQFRRKPEHCKFAPLRLNFKKSQTRNTVFDKQDKIKLVTHCQNRSPRYEQMVVNEYMAYRIFGLLSDVSFSARLLRVTYDFTDDNQQIESYGILLEHRRRLEKRTDTSRMRVKEILPTDLQPEYSNLLSVFQYMIGNTDFSPIRASPDANCCHNQVLLQTDDKTIYSVPYDFDMSGIVNAPYAAPHPRFKIKSVRDRLYRGRCANNALLPATLDYFRERRDEIETLIREEPALSKFARNSTLSFIRQFYKRIDDPRQVERRLVGACI